MARVRTGIKGKERKVWRGEVRTAVEIDPASRDNALAFTASHARRNGSQKCMKILRHIGEGEKSVPNVEILARTRKKSKR